jgi:hypothetical protein
VVITVEGFDQADKAELGFGAVEIADLVRYFESRNTTTMDQAGRLRCRGALRGRYGDAV